jgi:3',5'-cyclic AMP phosphodiesterase CpdA
LITGDLTDDGRPEEYAALRELLAPLSMPYLLIPGNHDDRENLRRAFSDCSYLPKEGPYLHYVVEDYPVRLIGLDTTLPGETGGALCNARLAWLAARLAEVPDRPTVFFLHHPPFPTGMFHMDEMGLDDPEPLAELIARYPRVERILCGHLHRPIQVRFAGTIAATAPATAYQIALTLTEDTRARWRLEPPAVLLHLWRPDVGIVTHTSYIADYGPERAFSEYGA